MDAIRSLFADPNLSALLIALTTLAFADFAIAVLAAIGRREFSASMLASWCETHLAARVLPIAVLAILGAGNAALFAIASIAAATYAVETLASIRDTLQVPDTTVGTYLVSDDLRADGSAAGLASAIGAGEG